MIPERKAVPVLGAMIDVVGWDAALERLMIWALERESRYVCICNVHSLITTTQNSEYGHVVNEADMATPDGAPVAWIMRRLGYAGQMRINGPDLMWRYCEQSQARAEPIFLYGSSEQTLATLKVKLLAAFPAFTIAGAISPPFRALTPEEDATIVEQINSSNAGVVFVSLGCPKQELWMASHRGKINAVMIGVGAAFDYHAGTINRAPKWMQDYGLEWFYRLASEPRRLWKRYFVTNTLFLFGAARQLLGERSKSRLAVKARKPNIK
jgi:N-acetylglucosaminyldiphosphoundecaprenol N-acetyl-beta-D-mannosaminyltransferase